MFTDWRITKHLKKIKHETPSAAERKFKVSLVLNDVLISFDCKRFNIQQTKPLINIEIRFSVSFSSVHIDVDPMELFGIVDRDSIRKVDQWHEMR